MRWAGTVAVERTHTHTNTHTRTHTHPHTYTHTHLHTQILTQTHTNTQAHTHLLEHIPHLHALLSLSGLILISTHDAQRLENAEDCLGAPRTQGGGEPGNAHIFMFNISWKRTYNDVQYALEMHL